MIPKLTELDLLDIEKFVPEKAQGINETLENLLIFVKELFKVFPENDFIKISKLSTLLYIAQDLSKTHPRIFDDQDVTLCTKSGDLFEINFRLMIPIELKKVDNYFAYISLSLQSSGLVLLSIDEKDSNSADLEKSPFYKEYFSILEGMLNKLELANGSIFNFLAGRRRYLNSKLNLKDTLLVLKTIHHNGFTLVDVPKN